MGQRHKVINKKGLLVAELGSNMFDALMENVEGHWGRASNGEVRFYIDADCAYTAHKGDNALTLYYWKGYSITEAL